MKTAIVLICFGNSDINPQLKTLKKEIIEHFPNHKIFTTFTSEYFIEKYGHCLTKTLNYIYKKKYKNIICLPLFVTKGCEYEKYLNIICEFEHRFNHIKKCSPLLSNYDDYKEIYDFILKSNDKPKLYVCHGTYKDNNLAYKKFFNINLKNVFFINLKFTPSIKDILPTLKFNNVSYIEIVPFFLFKGKHTSEDIAGAENNSIKNILLNEGMLPEVHSSCLMEHIEIRNIFIKHLTK